MITISKTKYYNIQPILKKNADYNIIYGMRSNGKTFGACEVALTSHVNNGARVAYIRRYQEEITPKRIHDLFTPHPIKKITGNKFNCTEYKSNRFYLSLADEKGDIVERESIPFCQTFALNTWERDKGVDNGKFDYIIFDEFITRGSYLPNEFIIFCNVLSTLMRDRDGTKIFMLGNTTAEYFCPYFEEMGLTEITDNLEQGGIATTTTREGLKIAIEYCNPVAATARTNKYFSFNNPRLQMITTGKWETKNYPHLERKSAIKPENIVARFYITYMKKCFIGDIVQYDNDIFINFHSGNIEEYKSDLHFSISDDPVINPYHTTSVFVPRCRAHDLFLKLLNEQRCFYSNNSIGEQVRAWIRHERQLKQIYLD